MNGSQIPNTPTPPGYYPRKRSRWWIPLVIIGVIILFTFVVFIAIVSSIGSIFQKKPVVVKSNSVLVINLSNNPINEYLGESLTSVFATDGSISFYDLLKGIEYASVDKKIRGIYLRCSYSLLGWAKRAELVEALQKFKDSGKFIYAFIEMGNESDYFTALPANKIILAREGLVEMNGFSVSALFLKGLFDKIGIEYYVQQFEDFKSAGEQFSRTRFSDSARLAYREILNQRYKTFLSALQKYRNIPEKVAQELLDKGIYSPDSLLKFKFIDTLLNDNQAKEYIKSVVVGKEYKGDTTKSKVNFISIKDYLTSEELTEFEKRDKENAIAIVYASGPIVQRTAKSPFNLDLEIDPDNFIKNLKKARDDSKVKAIIIRIDSPGGSVIASDEIWEEIQKTKKIKPVYASMSDVAASGGYYIAMACDTIIAHPMTITGSIGVISMVPNFSKMIGKIGITVDTLSTNQSSQDLNLFIPFSEKQKDKLEELARPIYYRFIDKVAKSRNKSFEETRAIAKGRVWTGERAKEIGLVDTLGGLYDAIKLVSKRIGIRNPTIKRYPKPLEDIEVLLKILSRQKDEAMAFENLPDIFNIIQVFPKEIHTQILQVLRLQSAAKNEYVFLLMPYILWSN